MWQDMQSRTSSSFPSQRCITALTTIIRCSLGSCWGALKGTITWEACKNVWIDFLSIATATNVRTLHRAASTWLRLQNSRSFVIRGDPTASNAALRVVMLRHSQDHVGSPSAQWHYPARMLSHRGESTPSNNGILPQECSQYSWMSH